MMGIGLLIPVLLIGGVAYAAGLGLTDGERAGLVKDDGLDLAGLLQRGGVLVQVSPVPAG